MGRRLRQGGQAILAGAVALGLLAAPALAAGAPPDLPGPPPGAGQGLPLPPPPGQAPAPQASQPATAIAGTPYGPGLLSATAAVKGKTLPVRIACQGNGRARLRAGTLGVTTTFRCAAGRSTVKFALTRSQASTLARSANLIGSLTLQQGATTVHLSLSLGPAPAPSFWISAFGLSCPGGGGGSATLLAPNFSADRPTTIDVRPWLAWYTGATGWQWLGTRGPDQSAWYRWTATPNGVAEWQQPGGITPWTWGPISVTPGHGVYLISVMEAIYWYGHPNNVWEYVHSEPSSTTTSTYCVYP